MSILDKFKSIKEDIKEQSFGKNKEVKDNEKINKQTGLEVKLPGCEEFVPLGKSQFNRIHLDDIGGRLLIIVDETAELLEPGGIKTLEGKEEDALKQETVGLMKSITQLGRSSGMHMVICTQRNDSSIIPGVIQNNPVAITSQIRVLRRIDIIKSKDIK